MIEKNMQLTSVYFEPLDVVYERMFPFFNTINFTGYRSKYLVGIVSAMRRAQYFDEMLLRKIVKEFMKRGVVEFVGK